jgi:hypothetical protein
MLNVGIVGEGKDVALTGCPLLIMDFVWNNDCEVFGFFEIEKESENE